MTWSERVGGSAISRPMPARAISPATISSDTGVPMAMAAMVIAAGPAMNTSSVDMESSAKAERRCAAGTSTDREVRTIDHTGRLKMPPTKAISTSVS